MNEKTTKAKGSEDGLIMEFRELIDGNFMMILNGKKLKERVDSGSFSIDLNSPITGVKHTPLGILSFHRLKTFMRGELPEIIRTEILKLNNDDEKLIKSFLKKYGFEAIEVPVVRNYFREVVTEARNENPEDKESNVCKKKLKRLIKAMSHTDTKVKIINDFSITELIGYLEEIENRAKRFYPKVIDFCWNCDVKKSSYSKCEDRMGCGVLIEYINVHLPDYIKIHTKKFLTFNSPSEYIAETFRKKLGVDRTRSEELWRYAKHIREQI